MARKPKVIEVPGDTAPVVEQAQNGEKQTPAPTGRIIDRMGDFVLIEGVGWVQVTKGAN